MSLLLPVKDSHKVNSEGEKPFRKKDKKNSLSPQSGTTELPNEISFTHNLTMMKRNILEPFLSQPVFFETSKKPNTAIYCIIVKNSGPLE